MDYLFIDFETRSRIDLKLVGANRYFEDPSTEIISAAWALNHGTVYEWHRGDRDAVWTMHAHHRDVIIVAHNAEFERLAFRHKCNLNLPAEKFRCTAALLANYGLPRSLEEGGRALNVEHQKLGKGGRVIQKLCKPRRPSKENPDEFWEEETAPDDYEDLYEYNRYDVETMRDIFYLLPPMVPKEQKVWELTVRMNDRGLLIDRESIAAAVRLASEEVAKLHHRWKVLTKHKSTPTSSAAAATLSEMWPAGKITSVDKVHVRRLLKRQDLPLKVRQCLQIRKQIARSSLAKLNQMLRRVSMDGRYRGGYVYAGAERTQRWSSWGVQLHNLPRGLGDKTDDAFLALHSECMPLVYDDVLGTLSDMLKGFIAGPFLLGDYAQIEARVLAWYAGQQKLLDAFRRGEDVYLQMASQIYKTPVAKGDFDENLHLDKRQLGKITILACGFGLSGKTFSSNAEKNWDIDIPINTANEIVETYRYGYPKVPMFWRRIEFIAREAIRRGAVSLRPTENTNWYAGVREFDGRKFATIGLPSGRALWYYRPEADHEGKWPSGDPKLSMRYYGRLPFKKEWTQIETYGGKLTENAVQKTARDFMADGMLALDDAGFHPALTTHDEVGAEGREEDLPEFKRIMSAVPEWAEGLPVSVDAHWSRRYRK